MFSTKSITVLKKGSKNLWVVSSPIVGLVIGWYTAPYLSNLRIESPQKRKTYIPHVPWYIRAEEKRR